jgi:hypothetical protein
MNDGSISRWNVSLEKHFSRWRVHIHPTDKPPCFWTPPCPVHDGGKVTRISRSPIVISNVCSTMSYILCTSYVSYRGALTAHHVSGRGTPLVARVRFRSLQVL